MSPFSSLFSNTISFTFSVGYNLTRECMSVSSLSFCFFPTELVGGRSHDLDDDQKEGKESKRAKDSLNYHENKKRRVRLQNQVKYRSSLLQERRRKKILDTSYHETRLQLLLLSDKKRKKSRHDIYNTKHF